MKIVKNIVTFLACMCVWFYFCNLADCSQDKLPATWQPGMILTITYGGGMRQYSSTIEIKEKNSYQEIREKDKVKRKAMDFTKSELDSLVQFLKIKAFDKISSIRRANIELDMETTATSLQWNGGMAEVSAGSGLDIAEKDKANFAAIYQYINKLLGRKGVSAD